MLPVVDLKAFLASSPKSALPPTLSPPQDGQRRKKFSLQQIPLSALCAWLQLPAPPYSPKLNLTPPSPPIGIVQLGGSLSQRARGESTVPGDVAFPDSLRLVWERIGTGAKGGGEGMEVVSRDEKSRPPLAEKKQRQVVMRGSYDWLKWQVAMTVGRDEQGREIARSVSTRRSVQQELGARDPQRQIRRAAQYRHGREAATMLTSHSSCSKNGGVSKDSERRLMRASSSSVTDLEQRRGCREWQQRYQRPIAKAPHLDLRPLGRSASTRRR